MEGAVKVVAGMEAVGTAVVATGAVVREEAAREEGSVAVDLVVVDSAEGLVAVDWEAVGWGVGGLVVEANSRQCIRFYQLVLAAEVVGWPAVSVGARVVEASVVAGGLEVGGGWAVEEAEVQAESMR
jgi:hypothetical protein